MKSRVDIIWFGDTAALPKWEMGEVVQTSPSPGAVHKLINERLSTTSADAWLFWDGSFGAPDPDKVKEALGLPGDVWHAGLRLKTTRQIGLLDLVNPTWTLNCDPDMNIEATS